MAMFDQSRHGSRPELTVDGAPLAADVVPALIRVIVDSHLHLPDMFVLQFRDTEREVVRRANISFGSRIEVSATADGDGTLSRLISGEVTALEQQTDGTGTSTIVRGYDQSHRLSRGRHTRTFADTTDADIVRRIGGEAGLSIGEVSGDGPTYTHVSQLNLTDWEFLRSRAHETGHEVSVHDGALNWRRPADSGTAPSGSDDLLSPAAPHELLLGRDLHRFSPRVSAAEQVSEVQVRSWDPTQKQTIVGSAQASCSSAGVGIGPAQLAKTFSASPFVVVDRPVTSQGEADALAAAVADHIAGVHAEAEATAHGDPLLRPGQAVRIGGVGWPHDGNYVVTTARHTYDDGGYRTEFTVSGRTDRSLLGLASLGATKGARRASGPLINGLVIGQVTDCSDPENLFRVKVAFPWLSDDYESWWCRVSQPGAGNQRGMLWLPEVGDEVLVGFAHGDSRVPYVVGSLYNGVDTPPLADQLVDSGSGEVKLRALVSRTNHRLVLSDDDSDSHVLLSTGDDKLTITMDKSQTAITIDSSGTITIQGSQKIQIKSDSDISLQAGGSLSLSGQTGVSIDGGPSVSVSGQLIKLN
ncbi:VgrG-related protein [soil metagenome]